MTKKDTDQEQNLEKQLWKAADKLRNNMVRAWFTFSNK